MISPKFMTDYTPQSEWSEGKGMFLPIAFFLGGIGGGLYLLSLFLNFLPGAIIGWLIVILGKFPAHLLFLGRPLRFWRLLLKPQTSWIARSMITEISFSIFPLLQFAPDIQFLQWLPWTSHNPVFLTLAVLAAFTMIASTGFIIAGSLGIPFWNTPTIPLLMVLYSFLGGTGVLLLISPVSSFNLETVETIARWLLVICAATVIIYLWSIYYAVPAAKQSVLELFKGRAALPFLVGVVILGLVIPLAVAIPGFFHIYFAPGIIVFAALCELVGGFSLRYSILRAGFFAPTV